MPDCSSVLNIWLTGCICRAGEPGRYVDAAGADYLSGYPAELGAGRRALAVGGNAAVFVPAVVAVVNYTQLLMVDGWRIFLVIALSTLMVLGATAWVVDKVYRYEVSRMKHE